MVRVESAMATLIAASIRGASVGVRPANGSADEVGTEREPESIGVSEVVIRRL
jgi:hypothetical protein